MEKLEPPDIAEKSRNLYGVSRVLGMKKLIAVVVALMMSGPVMADSIATVEGTDRAWAIIDEDVYLCFREKQHSSGEKRTDTHIPSLIGTLLNRLPIHTATKRKWLIKFIWGDPQ